MGAAAAWRSARRPVGNPRARAANHLVACVRRDKIAIFGSTPQIVGDHTFFCSTPQHLAAAGFGHGAMSKIVRVLVLPTPAKDTDKY